MEGDRKYNSRTFLAEDELESDLQLQENWDEMSAGDFQDEFDDKNEVIKKR